MSEKAPSPFQEKINKLDEQRANEWIEGIQKETEEPETSVDYKSDAYYDRERQKLEELDAYYNHMEKLAGETRSDFDRGLDRLESGEEESRALNLEKDDAIAENEAFDAKKAEEKAEAEAKEAALVAKIASDPSLRRMDAMAERLANLKETGPSDRDPAQIKDLEDKLNDLLARYEDSDDFDSEVADRIINNTEKEKSAEDAVAPEADKAGTPAETADKTPEADKTDGTEDDGEGEKPTAAEEEKESPELTEKEKREIDILDAWDNLFDDETDYGDLDFEAEFEKYLDTYTDADGKPLSDEEKDALRTRRADDIAKQLDDIDLGKPVPTGTEGTEPAPEATATAEKPADDGERLTWMRNPIKRFKMAILDLRAGGAMDHLRDNKKTYTAIGAGAIVIATALVVAERFGLFDSNVADAIPDAPKGPEFNGPNAAGSDLPLGEKPSTGVNPAEAIQPPAEVFSDAARNANPGEGWLNELNEIFGRDLSPAESTAMLEKLNNTTDPAIREWVYTMADGNPGISKPGTFPVDVLKSIKGML